MWGIRGRLSAIRKRLKRISDRGPHPVILMYHRIATLEIDPFRLAVSPGAFADQLAALGATRRVVSMDQLVEGLLARSLTGQEVALTFDDGYLDNLTAAKPLLQRYGASATLFVTTRRLGAADDFWWDELAQLCLAPGPRVDARVEIVGQTIELSVPRRAARTSSPWCADMPPTTQAERLFIQLWTLLQRQDDAARSAALEQLRRAFAGAPPAPRDRLLRVEDLPSLTDDGTFSLGGHSQTHQALTTLSPEQTRTEIENCRRDLETWTGCRPSGFAYPFGDRDEAVVAATRAAGYAWAVSTHKAALNRRHFDPFDLPRLQIADWTGVELVQRLSRLQVAS